MIYIDPDGDHAICVPGFKEGHRFESFPTVHMIKMNKGYSDEPCGWWKEKKKKLKKVSEEEAKAYFEERAGITHVSENMTVHEPKKQKVDHPEHYNQTKYECIEEMIHLFGIEAVKNFCKCNIYKYKYRANFKNGEEDLKKADKYMDILIDLEKREPKEDDKLPKLPLPRRIFINSFGGCDIAAFGEDDNAENK